jgi:hypothetical protein
MSGVARFERRDFGSASVLGAERIVVDARGFGNATQRGMKDEG